MQVKRIDVRPVFARVSGRGGVPIKATSVAHPLAVSVGAGVLGLLGYFIALFGLAFAGLERAALGFGTGSSGPPAGAFSYLPAILAMILAAGGFVFAFGVAVVTFRALAGRMPKCRPDTSKA